MQVVVAAALRHVHHRRQRSRVGQVQVPAERYWGAQTERARQQFRLGNDPIPLPLIHAIATIKRAIE